MENLIIMIIIVTIAISAGIVATIIDYDKKNNPIKYIKKKVIKLFDEYNYDYKIVDIKLFAQMQTEVSNTIEQNLKMSQKENPDLFKNYFRKVNINKWIRVKSYEIISNYFHENDLNENEKQQVTNILEYLYKEKIKYKEDTI